MMCACNVLSALLVMNVGVAHMEVAFVVVSTVIDVICVDFNITLMFMYVEYIVCINIAIPGY